MWRHRACGSTYSESKSWSAVSHDGNSWRENTTCYFCVNEQPAFGLCKRPEPRSRGRRCRQIEGRNPLHPGLFLASVTGDQSLASVPRAQTRFHLPSSSCSLFFITSSHSGLILGGNHPLLRPRRGRIKRKIKTLRHADDTWIGMSWWDDTRDLQRCRFLSRIFKNKGRSRIHLSGWNHVVLLWLLVL